MIVLFFVSCLPPADKAVVADGEDIALVDVNGDPVADVEEEEITIPDFKGPVVAASPLLGLDKAQKCTQISKDIKDKPANQTHIVSPISTGRVLYNGNTTTLRSVIQNASAGDLILLEDGEYTFDEAGSGSYTGVYISKANIIIRGRSGDASKVILNSRYLRHGSESATITIDAPGVVIADLTVTKSIFHLIHIWKNGDDVSIHNVHLLNGGQQFLKASPNTGSADGANISCNKFIMDTEGRKNVWGYGALDGHTRCYTGGIDTHNANDWTIQDNYFEGIYCESTGTHPAHRKNSGGTQYSGGLAEHAIHMWDTDSGTTHYIERNKIVNCARGIGVNYKAGRAVIANNMISSTHAGSSEHDVGIIVEAINNA